MRSKKTLIIIMQFLLVLQISGIVLFLKPQKAHGTTHNIGQADCGSILDTAGDTYILIENMSCTGHGLRVGANGITIDGDGHTITGDYSGTDNGIYNSGSWDNIIIQNFSNITNFGTGINFSGSSGTYIQNNNINSNKSYGVILISSNSNTLTGNTANSNSYGICLSSSNSNTLTGNTANSNTIGIYLSSSTSNALTNNNVNSSTTNGIYLSYSNSNTLTGNTANSNSYGIYIYTSFSNTLTNNTMSGNTYNLHVFVSSTAQYDNSINTTNKVEGKSVYYFYNLDGVPENPVVYDGNEIGDIGMFWCISCDYVQVKNAALSTNNYYGVNFYNSTNSVIQNITTTSNKYGIILSISNSNTLTSNTISSNTSYGIYLSDSTSNTLADNTASFNPYGIYLQSSNSNTLTGNTVSKNDLGIILNGSSSNTMADNIVESNSYGIYLSNSNSNTLTDNIISNNSQDLFYPGTTNIYSQNRFNHNNVNRMFNFTEVSRIKNTGDVINFNISTYNLGDTDCNGCATITTSPSEEVVINSEIGNDITGHFIPTRSGTYSMKFTITDSNSNITRRNIRFFVGTTSSKTTTYYLRGISPTHGQPYGTGQDSKSLLFEAPTSTEEVQCTNWIQSSPDALPNYPLSNLSTINMYNWYKQSAASEAYTGVERYLTYGSTVDYNNPVDPAANYTWINKTFDNLNWGIDYPNSWYWLVLKLKGSNPRWATFPPGETNKSHADFTYQYSTTPAVKSISNPDDVNILSAIEPANGTDPAGSTQIILDGIGSTDIDLDNFNHAFSGYQTTITKSGGINTATLAVTGLTGETTVNAKKLAIDPNVGNIQINIDTWNTGGNYSKQWRETGSGVTSAGHTIGNLAANTYYTVTNNDDWTYTYKSNESGEITFTYDGDYSEHTFNLTPDTTSPTLSISSPTNNSSTTSNSVTVSGSAQDAESDVVSVTVSANGSNHSVSSSFSQSVNLNMGSNSITVTATDNAGNSTTQTLTITRTSSSKKSTARCSMSFSKKPVYYGQRSSTVKKLQNILKKHKCFPKWKRSSGYFGFMTKLAIRRYQWRKNLKVSGKIDSATLSYLNCNGYYIFTKNLKYGSRGKDVIMLQSKLKQYHYLPKYVSTSGYFNGFTKRALKHYQRQHHLRQTGILDASTRRALNRN